MFWNVAGLERRIKISGDGFDFISLCETWMDRKGWERIKDRLPDTHEWDYSEARREKKGVERREVL